MQTKAFIANIDGTALTTFKRYISACVF